MTTITEEREMKIDWNKPVQTRDGRKARVLCTDRKSENYPVVALVTQSDGEEVFVSRTIDGSDGCDENWPGDLINVPEKRVVWLNMYPDESTGVSKIRATKNEADDCACPDRIARVRVEYEVGQFDD